MAIKLSTDVRNARLDAIETTAGTTAILKMFDGNVPANCAAADDGTEIAVLTLPEDWMGAGSGGSAVLAGTWQDTSADNAGTVEYFRIYETTATTCHVQGTVTITSGGGDMELDNDVVAAGQSISVTTFTLTDGNA